MRPATNAFVRCSSWGLSYEAGTDDCCVRAFGRWLADAHEALDRAVAVAAAYGWPEDISTEDALAGLRA
jgi:hypothetical protein